MAESTCSACRGFGYTKGGPEGPWEKLDCKTCKGTGQVPDPVINESVCKICGRVKQARRSFERGARNDGCLHDSPEAELTCYRLGYARLEKEKLLWDEWDAQDRQKTREINILTKENRELAAQQKMLEELVRAWMDLRLVGNIRTWREKYGAALGEDFDRMYVRHSFDRPIERLLELTEARGIHSLIPKE